MKKSLRELRGGSEYARHLNAALPFYCQTMNSLLARKDQTLHLENSALRVLEGLVMHPRSFALVFVTFIMLAAIVVVAPALATDPSSPPAPAPSGFMSPGTESVLLPKGTLIVVAVRRSYKSYGASTGTKITYDVTQDVIIGGYVVVREGDVAEGEILNAHEGRSNIWTGETEGANLRISVDKVYNYCGDTIETDFARSEFRNKQGLFGGKKDVEISKGQKYQVPTERPQKVCASRTSALPMPIPSDALEGDKN
jgi:hypothetical protein